MSKEAVLEKIKGLGLLAVIRGPSPDLTVQMVEALIQGGVLGIEITYSTPNAEEVVKTLATRYADEIVLGMGTLTKPEQAERAKNAGASFLVSPICESALIKAMIDTGEVEKLIHMEERLRQRVVGQNDAINAVSNAVRRARAGLQDPKSTHRLLHLHGAYGGG